MGAMHAITYAALVIWCAVLSAIDIRTRRLPDALTLPGAAAVVAVAALTGHGALACGGALLLAAPYLLVHLVAPAACGAGDVKLALGTGAAAACGGAQCWVWAALGAPLLTALAGAGLLAAGRLSGRPGIAALPVPGSAEFPLRTRTCEPPRRPGRDVQGSGTRSDQPDSMSARSVLTASITVPHGPAMCLATVAALWPTL